MKTLMLGMTSLSNMSVVSVLNVGQEELCYHRASDTRVSEMQSLEKDHATARRLQRKIQSHVRHSGPDSETF